MSSSTPSLSLLAGLIIAMTPLAANADAGRAEGKIICPFLLTERECHDYQAAQRQARSGLEMASLEEKYATLLKERSLLCPQLIGMDAADEVKGAPHTYRPRSIPGK